MLQPAWGQRIGKFPHARGVPRNKKIRKEEKKKRRKEKERKKKGKEKERGVKERKKRERNL